MKPQVYLIKMTCRKQESQLLVFFSFFLSYLPMVKNHARAITLETYNKRQKGLPLETKNSQNHENWRLGLIESLHMQL